MKNQPLSTLALAFSLCLPACAQTAPPAQTVAPAPPTRPANVAAAPITPTDARRWSEERIWKWYGNQAWPCGFNYIPAHSISYTEMWMPYNFDLKKIDAELALAQKDGFNCARVVLPFVVWEHDPKAFKTRFAQFLAVCAKRGIKVMPALFDDCVFGPITQPVYGPQPVVVPGWYANGWTPSPGHAIVRDRAQWPRLQKYVADMVSSFKNDARVWVWDVYNEPSASELTVELVGKTFDWARAQAPSQPLTCDVFGSYDLRRLAFSHSDVLSFHNYGDAKDLQNNINTLKLSGRPLICTEWLNRAAGSTVQACLPVLARENVGAMHWGLVNGRTQTNLRWGAQPGQPTPALWQHDLYRSQYTVESIPEGGYGFGPLYDAKAAQVRPYRNEDLDLFRSTIRTAAQTARPARPAQTWLVPTAGANDAKNLWRYSLQQPDDNWFKPNFTAENWSVGVAGFGTDAPNSWPRTTWNTPDIWLRRHFALDKVPTNLQLWVHHDETAEIYVNGQKIWASTEWTETYSRIELDAQARAAFQKGDNVIAVHCHQTAGGQYIDVGVSAVQ